MIAAVARADEILTRLHYADWPDGARCGRAERYLIHRDSRGAVYRVGRCGLPDDHDGHCLAPYGAADRRAVAVESSWPSDPPAELDPRMDERFALAVAPMPKRTLCGEPMPESALWVRIDPRPGDPVCPDCSGAAP